RLRINTGTWTALVRGDGGTELAQVGVISERDHSVRRLDADDGQARLLQPLSDDFERPTFGERHAEDQMRLYTGGGRGLGAGLLLDRSYPRSQRRREGSATSAKRWRRRRLLFPPWRTHFFSKQDEVVVAGSGQIVGHAYPLLGAFAFRPAGAGDAMHDVCRRAFWRWADMLSRCAVTCSS